MKNQNKIEVLKHLEIPSENGCDFNEKVHSVIKEKFPNGIGNKKNSCTLVMLKKQIKL